MILDYFRPYPELKTAIVNTKSGDSFKGVIWRRRRAYLILKNAELLRNGESSQKIDGECFIYSANVEFLQVT